MKLLLTGAFKWQQEYIQTLENEGWEICFSEREDDLFDYSACDADAVVCNWLFANHLIEKFRNLKCIQLLSAGLDRVPLDYIKAHNISLFNAKGVYSIPLAEYAVCGALQLLKHSRDFADKQKNRIWQKDRNIQELSKKRVCILGAGSVGIEVAKHFSVFTEDIYGVDKVVTSNQWFKEICPLTDMDYQIRNCDVLILTLPLTEETRNLFNGERFSIMKQGAIFVNIARGGIVDENALSNALDTNLLGAVMDVFEEEPLPKDNPLWEKNNIIITPHNAFESDCNAERMWKVIHENLQRYSAGEKEV